jgi:hypothetical protein
MSGVHQAEKWRLTIENDADFVYNGSAGGVVVKQVERPGGRRAMLKSTREGGSTMSKQITLTLSNELHKQARHWAAITQQDLPEALIDALCIALTPALDAPRSNNPVTTLSDQELLARCKTEMDPAKGRRLSRLLRKQLVETLDEGERRELESLMYTRNRLWIRQSEAQAEAERRGLRVQSLS